MSLRATVLLLALAFLPRCMPDAPGSLPSPPPGPATQNADRAGPDLARGEALFRQVVPQARYACGTCHLTRSSQALLGPGLLNVGVGASPCDPLQEPEDYLRESILEPDACLTAGFSAGLMPAVYGQVWSEQDIDDVVAWMLTLRPGEEAE